LVTPRKKRAEIPKIDRDKLRTKLRRLGDEYVFYMLDDALDVLSDAQLAEFIGQYVKLEELAPDDSSGTAKRSLRDVVAAFDAACRRGEYYVSFAVNSKNYMDTSSGTRSFIADCQRLFVRALAESPKGAEPEEFAQVVVDAIDQFEEFARENHLAAARKVANPEQRRALAARASQKRR
jgi:hypothetical protein